jgi:S1-C subfamily serine protease
MFRQACLTVKECVYGVACSTPLEGNRANFSTGTGFMIAPGILATCAHMVHMECNTGRPTHQTFQVIRAPDIGQALETSQLIAEDIGKDIALLRIEHPRPRSTQSLTLEHDILEIGMSCGALGFPLSGMTPTGLFALLLRFQGAYISAHIIEPLPDGGSWEYYETDSLMYNGSSGCPLFTTNGHVFAMQSKVRTPQPNQQSQTDRFAISICVPSPQIIAFAQANQIDV